MKRLLALLIVGLIALPAAAQPTVDGTLDAADYGTALAVQTVNTDFGDNESEWNAAYATIDSGKLFLMFTGNLQANFNKLELFVDSVAGGSNVLDSIGNDGAGALTGMTLDTAIAPEYHFILRRGASKFDVDLATLNSGAFGPGSLIIDGNNPGPGEDVFGGSDAGSTTGIAGTSLDLAYDGSNVAGIGAGTGAADQAAALAVTTGLELSIDLADIGNPTGPIRVMLLQNNDNHDFLSNQTLGGLPAGTGNLGSPASGQDFSGIPGDQFFTIFQVPEPTSIGLGLLSVLGLTATRRRR
ncbi:MAG: hypothetical protein AAGA92_01795 [Planctomycetota bacterium]